MTVYGYARCSTNESKQDIDRQLRELKAHGAETIFNEFEHGDAAVKSRLDRQAAPFLGPNKSNILKDHTEKEKPPL